MAHRTARYSRFTVNVDRRIALELAEVVDDDDRPIRLGSTDRNLDRQLAALSDDCGVFAADDAAVSVQNHGGLLAGARLLAGESGDNPGSKDPGYGNRCADVRRLQAKDDDDPVVQVIARLAGPDARSIVRGASIVALVPGSPGQVSGDQTSVDRNAIAIETSGQMATHSTLDPPAIGSQIVALAGP